MASNPKRRLLDQIAGAPTYVAEGCRVTGDVEAPGPLVVCGTVLGDGDVRGPLHLATTAHWQGDVRAESAIVAGSVTGAVHVTGKMEIGANAVIRGRVVARTLAIARGAVIDGEVTITSGEEPVSFEEKREPGE